MFQSLGEKFDGLWRKLQGQGKITEKNIDEAKTFDAPIPPQTAASRHVSLRIS